jgi:hypothetical protein
MLKENKKITIQWLLGLEKPYLFVKSKHIAILMVQSKSKRKKHE